MASLCATNHLRPRSERTKRQGLGGRCLTTMCGKAAAPEEGFPSPESVVEESDSVLSFLEGGTVPCHVASSRVTGHMLWFVDSACPSRQAVSPAGLRPSTPRCT